MQQPADDDHEGILNALLLDGKGGAAAVGWREIENWTHDQQALWLQLDLASPRTVAWLASQGEGLATIGADDRRPRCEVVDDQTIRLGVRAWLPTLRPGAGESSLTNLWLQPRRAVVLSRGLLAELPAITNRLARGVGPATIAELVTEQIEEIARRLGDSVSDLQQPMADLEFAAVGGSGTPDETRHLAWQIANLLRHLAPTRVVVERLIAARPAWLVGDFLPRLTVVAQDLHGHEAELQNLQQRLGSVRDHLSDRRAARMNEILYVLTIVSSIMLPLTFITGLLGINVGITGASYRGMSSSLAFLFICALLAIVAWLEYRLLIRRNLLIRPPSRARKLSSKHDEAP